MFDEVAKGVLFDDISPVVNKAFITQQGIVPKQKKTLSFS